MSALEQLVTALVGLGVVQEKHAPRLDTDSLLLHVRVEVWRQEADLREQEEATFAREYRERTGMELPF